MCPFKPRAKKRDLTLAGLIAKHVPAPSPPPPPNWWHEAPLPRAASFRPQPMRVAGAPVGPFRDFYRRDPVQADDDSSTDLVVGVAVGEAIASVFDSSPSYDSSPAPDFSGGGGDFGGRRSGPGFIGHSRRGNWGSCVRTDGRALLHPGAL